MYRFFLLFSLFAIPLHSADGDAIAFSNVIRARHMPFFTILDPFLDSNGQVTGYTRCGDSALWTGHYLAAEAFRYRVTDSPAAINNVLTALVGIKNLIDVTGRNVLARCFVPKSSPFAEGIAGEEAHNEVFEGTCLGEDCIWIGNTSRDQYIGVFFGLGIVWDVIEDEAVRNIVRSLGTRLLDRLLDDDWAVKMPNGRISTTFVGRPEQRLMLLAVGSKINHDHFSSSYSLTRLLEGGLTGVAVLPETLDPHNSYFKFNLDVESFYHLLRFEGSGFWYNRYLDTYEVLRRTLDDHGNAHFNMIDRALRGPDAARDRETRELLDQWLERPMRDYFVDLRGRFPSCVQDDRACQPIPVPLRVRTDFLWQRSPFLLFGGGEGNIESPGIDYMLPYWMARFYEML